MSDFPDDIAKDILDLAARIGTTAKKEGVRKSQLEQLAASLEGYPHDKYCVLVTASFANRQVTRDKLRRDTARAVVEAMKKIYEYKESGLNKKELARILLDLSKWVYEAVDQVRIERPVTSYEELLRIFAGSRG
ncbi:hypothetical protein HRbin01_01463 [archaeon HR01]|nr:hypothetical protein HRbin01_01463 [archaeon HR01]